MSEHNSAMVFHQNGQQNLNQNNFGPGASRSTTSNGSKRLEIRFLVCSRDAGAIIGKKGSNIQTLRQKHKAIIQVPDCDGPERILSIQGEYDACVAALVDILPLMKDNQRTQNEQSEIRLLVHQSQAGAVIGKGGERVRELRSKYNVGMKVFVQCLPFSTERVAALRGRAEDIERCLREIFDILEKTPARGQTCFYDPYNFDQSICSEYGGFIDNTIGNPNHQSHSHNGGITHIPASHYGSSSADQNGPYNSTYSTSSNENFTSGLLPDPRPPIPSNPIPDTLKIKTTRVTIPDYLINVVVGRGGTTIANTNQISGAMIRIGDPEPGSSERIISIEGTPEQIACAQHLLQKAVLDSGLWNGY